MDTTTGGPGSSFATYSAANGLQALQAGDFSTTLTATDTIKNIVATSALTAPAGGLTINSLTLKTGSGLTIGAGNNIALDSGGLLATATASITGAGTLTTSATAVNTPANREIIIHTAGVGTTLTIATPIATTGGLTKAGDGTLVLSAANTFTGALRLNGGITMLMGGENRIFNVLSTPPPVTLATQGTTSTAANVLFVDAGATLNLNGNDQRVGGLATSYNAAQNAGSILPGTGGTITSATPATFRFSRSSAIIPTIFAGAGLSIQRDSSGTIAFTSPSTYGGTTTLTGGLTILQDGGALVSTTALAIRRAALSIDNTGLQSVVRLNAAATVGLDGGAITFLSRSGGTQDALNLGALSLNSGASLLRQDLGGATGTTVPSVTGTSTINILSLARSQGATVNFSAVANSNNVQLGDNPRVLLTSGTPVLTGGLIGGWATTQGFNSANPLSGNASFDFATYDPVTGIRPASYTSAFAPGNNVNLEPNNAAASVTTLAAGDTAINSLRLGGLGSTTSTTLNYSAAGDVLNLQTGGLLGTGGTGTRAISDTADFGRLTAGGGAVSGTSELFIHNGANTLTVNARIINNPAGAQVAVVLDAMSKTSVIQLTGSNTYTGTTYVNGVNVSLNSPGGPAIPGNLVINGGTADGGDSQTTGNQTVTLLASNQIAPGFNVRVNGGGGLNLGGFNNTIGSLTLAADGGGAGVGPLVQTGAGALTLTGGITVTNLLQSTTIPAILGNVTLPAGVHTVAIGTFAGAPGQVGLQINAAVTGGGSLNVTSGVLGIGNTVSTASVNLSAGTTLTLTNPTTATNITPTIGALTGSGKVNTALSGTAAVTLVVGNNNASGTYTGFITGPIGLSKIGTGTQTITQSVTLTSLSIAAGGTLVFGDGLPFAPFAPDPGFGAAVVPEPGSLGLLALGSLGLLARRRRG